MADRKQGQKCCIAHKLDYLEQQRTCMHKVVDRCVDGIVNAEKAWHDDISESEDDFQELSRQIDSTTAILFQKANEILNSEIATPLNSIQSRSLKVEQVSQCKTPQSDAAETVSDIDAQALYRIEAVEKSLEALRTTNGRMNEINQKVADFQSIQDENGEKMKNLFSELSKSQSAFAEMSATFCETQSKVTDLSTQQSEICSKVDELSSKVTETEGKLNEKSEEQAASQTIMQEVIDKYNDTHKAQFDDISTNLELMSDKMDKMSEVMNETERNYEETITKYQESEKNINDITCQQRQTDGRVDDLAAKQMENDEKMDEITLKQWENGQKLTEVSVQLSDTTRKVQDLSTEMCQVNQSLKDSGQLLDRLSEKITKTEEGIRDLSDMDRFSEMEKKMKTLEKHAQEDLQFFDKQLQHVKSKYDMIRHMVDKRLVSLERLRDILNQRRQGAKERVQKFKKEVNDLSAQMLHMSEEIEKINGVKEEDSDLSSHIGNLKQQLKEIEQDVSDWTRETSTNTGRLDQQVRKVKHIEREVSDLSKETSANTGNLDQQVRNLDQQVRKIKDIEQEVSDLSKETSANTGNVDQQVGKIKQVKQEVSQKLDHISKTLKSPVGFAGSSSTLGKSNKGKHMIQFKDVKVNVGGHFDSDSGIFTAPCDGIYFVSLANYIHPSRACVYLLRTPSTIKDVVCAVQSCDSHTVIGIVHIKTGEELFVRGEQGHATCSILLSCFLIG